MAAEWDGCCYLLRADLVLAASAGAGPRLVAFDADAAGGRGRAAACRWATPAEAAVRASAPSGPALLRCAGARLRHGRGGRQGVPGAPPSARAGLQGFRARLAPVLEALRAAAAGRAPLLRLGAVAGAPLMPSLNGFLLGYPLVYLAHAGNVDAAARCLSDAPLLLVRALAPAPPQVPVPAARQGPAAGHAGRAGRDYADACSRGRASCPGPLAGRATLELLLRPAPGRAPRHAAPPSGARSDRQERGAAPALLASFTAPADLMRADERRADSPWLARWLAAMQDAADASELWASRRGPLRLETSTVCCRVAL